MYVCYQSLGQRDNISLRQWNLIQLAEVPDEFSTIHNTH